MRSLLIVGCGDIGRRVAVLARADGLQVTGLVRRPEMAGALRADGITPLLADLDEPVSAWQAALAAVDAVIWCAPPPAQGVDEPRLAGALAAARSQQSWLYLSTTAVYGDCGGRWIDESAPLKPKTDRGRRRLAAETQLLDWQQRSGGRALILRVPGIYGPGRLPVARLQRGEPVLCVADSPCSNRIHADDLAAALLLVLARGESGGAWHISDGQPGTMTEYFLACAAHLGLPPPPQVDLATAKARFSATLLSYLEESKRLDCRRLRQLGFTPRYPTLRDGLRSLAAVTGN